MKELNWGIVSTGTIAHQFCQDLASVKNGKLAAVAARSLDNAKVFAAKYDIPKAYQGYQAMFDDPDIDVVYIATPHTLHFEHSRDALLAGKHVLCEKPVTVSAEEMNALSDLAHEKGLFFMEAMWTYFLPAIEQAKTWVDAGRIGKIKHIKSDFGYPLSFDPSRREWDAELAGGCLLEMGIYPLAIAQYFLGNEPQLSFVDAQLAPNGVEKDVSVISKVGDAICQLATSYQCKLQNWTYVIGEQGYIAIPNSWRADTCMLYKLDECIDAFVDNRDTLGFNFEAEAVGEAIAKGLVEHPQMPHERSLSLQLQMAEIKEQF